MLPLHRRGLSPDSIPMLGQCWNIGTSVGPTLVANVGPMAFRPAEVTFAQCRQASISQSDSSMVLCGHCLIEGM